MTPPGDPLPPMLSGPQQWLCVSLGLLFVGLAALGAVLPLLPATPFLLLASYFFVRSSPSLTRWLHGSRTFGPLLRNWQSKRAVSRRVKFTAIVVLVVSAGASIYFTQLSWAALSVFLGLTLIGLLVVMRLPTLPATSSPTSETTQPCETGSEQPQG